MCHKYINIDVCYLVGNYFIILEDIIIIFIFKLYKIKKKHAYILSLTEIMTEK